MLDNYTIEQYKIDIDKNGMELVWLDILEYCKYNRNNKVFNICNIGYSFKLFNDFKRR